MTTMLCLCGSPRKGGNTDLLMESVMAGAAERGVSTRKVYVADLSMSGCDACETCKTGTRECALTDDMTPLYRDFLESDVLLIGTPVYWYGPSAQLKAVIDRLFAFADAPGQSPLAGKRAIVLVALEEEPQQAEHVIGMLDKSFAYLGVKCVGTVVAQAGPKGAVKENREAMNRAYQLGRSLASAG